MFEIQQFNSSILDHYDLFISITPKKTQLCLCKEFKLTSINMWKNKKKMFFFFILPIFIDLVYTYFWTWKGRHIFKHIHQYFTFVPIFLWFIFHLNIDLQKSIFTNRCSWWNHKTSTCYQELNRFGTKQLLLFQRFDKHFHSNPKTH
jgi:hypothetical protein